MSSEHSVCKYLHALKMNTVLYKANTCLLDILFASIGFPSSAPEIREPYIPGDDLSSLPRMEGTWLNQRSKKTQKQNGNQSPMPTKHNPGKVRGETGDDTVDSCS